MSSAFFESKEKLIDLSHTILESTVVVWDRGQLKLFDGQKAIATDEKGTCSLTQGHLAWLEESTRTMTVMEVCK